MATTKNKKPTTKPAANLAQTEYTELINALRNFCARNDIKVRNTAHFPVAVFAAIQKKIDEDGKSEKELIDEIRTIARKHGLEKITLGETLNRLDGALSYVKAMESQIKEQDRQIKLLAQGKENAHRAISDLSSKLKERDDVINDLFRGIKALHREHVGLAEGWTMNQLFDSLNNAFLAKKKETSRDRGETAFRRYVYTHVMIAMMDEFKGKPVNDHARLIAARAEKIIGYAEKFAKGS